MACTVHTLLFFLHSRFQALGERQDKLKTIQRKCEDLEDGAAGFSSLADKLVAKKKKKKKSSKKKIDNLTKD